VILVTAFYLDSDAGRRGEFIECIRRNAGNPCIEQVHVFLENRIDPGQLRELYSPFGTANVTLVSQGCRVTFRDLFTYANTRLPRQRVIVANSDIYFDSSLARLDGYDLTSKLLCLSRWDVGPDGLAQFLDDPSSQDAWIFETPIRDFSCDFHMGVPECDNRIAWEARHAGLAVSNPSRSIRAHHLHLSRVRRYSKSDGLPGPILSIPATFLGAPWLWFVVPCMGRLGDLRQTVDSILGQPRSSYVLVDYACPDEAGKWLRENRPCATVVTGPRRRFFQGAEARNLGTAAVDDDGILCFLDADVAASPEFSAHVLAKFAKGSFLVPDQQGKGACSTLACSKTDFDRIGGFDETFIDWGEEVLDLRASLCRLGLTELKFPASLISHLPEHRDTRTRFSVIRNRETALAIHRAYRRAKSVVLDETSGSGVSAATWHSIYQAIARSRTRQAGTDRKLAAVAFRETMGYTIARMETGISSHNNAERPFGAIPEALMGRPFTQVVSRRVSPVEVEFLASGKLYILVGTDWDGYVPATAWLREAGQPEPIHAVQTRRGTRFEVWSLAGKTGDRIVLPTQMMLVADRLERMP
jgi:hypothetical protein